MYIKMAISPKRRGYSIAEARARLPGLVHEAEERGPVELTRRGKPVAWLVGLAEYERLTGGTTTFADALRDFRRAFAPDTLGIDPDEVFGGIRERTPGRRVRL